MLGGKVINMGVWRKEGVYIGLYRIKLISVYTKVYQSNSHFLVKRNVYAFHVFYLGVLTLIKVTFINLLL